MCGWNRIENVNVGGVEDINVGGVEDIQMGVVEDTSCPGDQYLNFLKAYFSAFTKSI